jgi:hypothetical protein
MQSWTQPYNGPLSPNRDVHHRDLHCPLNVDSGRQLCAKYRLFADGLANGSKSTHCDVHGLQIQGIASAIPPTASSGSHSKAAGFAGVYLPCAAEKAVTQSLEQNLRCLPVSAFPHSQHIRGTGSSLNPPSRRICR